MDISQDQAFDFLPSLSLASVPVKCRGFPYFTLPAAAAAGVYREPCLLRLLQIGPLVPSVGQGLAGLSCAPQGASLESKIQIGPHCEWSKRREYSDSSFIALAVLPFLFLKVMGGVRRLKAKP